MPSHKPGPPPPTPPPPTPDPLDTYDRILSGPRDRSAPLIGVTDYDYRSDPGITLEELGAIDALWSIYKRPKLPPLPPEPPITLGLRGKKPYWYRPLLAWEKPGKPFERDPDNPDLPAKVLARPDTSYMEPRAYEHRMYTAFIERIAKEPDFRLALERAGTGKFAKFLSMLLDPQYARKRWTATALARACGITNVELERVWRDHKLADAMLRIVEKMPQIAEDIAEDSRSVMISCPRCEGWGTIERLRFKAGAKGARVEYTESAKCPTCQGAKMVRKPGDPDARRYALESIGWTGRNSTVNNYGIIQNNSGGVLDEFDVLGAIPSLPEIQDSARQVVDVPAASQESDSESPEDPLPQE